jgi:hypothetical protein
MRVIPAFHAETCLIVYACSIIKCLSQNTPAGWVERGDKIAWSEK